MKRYSTERKEAVLAKMAGPDRIPIPPLAKQERISEPTLYAWRNAARQRGDLLPDSDDAPEGWTSRDKFTAVMNTAGLSEEEVAMYCRENGLYPEQLQRWKSACERANDWQESSTEDLTRLRKQDAKRLKELERELRRKEKALAETAALLTLSKKLQEIWGEEDV